MSSSSSSNQTGQRATPIASTSSASTSTTSSTNNNAFSSNQARPAQASTASSNAKGKQPATGASAGAARVVIPGQQNSSGPVSIGGPGGVVRRATQNSILVNVCQVSSNECPESGHQLTSFQIHLEPTERESSHSKYQIGTMGMGRCQVRLSSRTHNRCSLPLVSFPFSPSSLSFTSLLKFICRIRYHLLHPEYVHTRIADLGQSYSLRIVLVHCDADNHTAAMRELTKICIVNNYTLLVAWSYVSFIFVHSFIP